jgi:hypothetical protein
MSAKLELYFSLSANERRIARTAAKMDLTPSILSLFQVYFPKTSADDLRCLIAEIRTQPDE